MRMQEKCRNNDRLATVVKGNYQLDVSFPVGSDRIETLKGTHGKKVAQSILGAWLCLSFTTLIFVLGKQSLI